MSPRVSIIICTCNRADSLRETLAAMGIVIVPPDLPAELLVVDNASTDNTREVARAASLPNMPVRYVNEPRRGKGHAYNSGMAAAAGDILLFTDDDVRPPANWIEGVCRVIADNEADAVAGGVRLAPALRRDWMKEYHEGWLSATNWISADEPGGVVGANMAFSKSATFGAGMRFDPELDPGGLGYYGDSLFSWQIVKRGLRFVSRLDVEVEHHPDSNRACRRAFVETAWKYGCSKAYIAHHWEHQVVPLLFLRLLRGTMRWLACRVRTLSESRHPDAIVYGEFLSVERVAFLWQLRRERRRARNYDRYGYVKRRGVLPDNYTASVICEAPARATAEI